MALFWQRKRDVLADSGLQLQCQVEGAHFVVLLSGRITIDSSPALRAELLRVLESGNCQTLTVDLHEVSYVDTSGVAILMEVLQGARATGKAFQLENLQQRPRYLFHAIGLLHFFDQADPEDGEPMHASGQNSPAGPNTMTIPVAERVGRATLRHVEYVGGLTTQLWNALRSLRRTLPLLGNRHRWQSAINQMVAIGIEAIPMVGIMAVCSGFILAMQGASELRRFGAMKFVIDLVTVGFTRELGPLLTAIAVSGRSGSAFSAEIGSMVVTEKVDALRTMAIEPIEFILAPKYLGALVALPCLA